MKISSFAGEWATLRCVAMAARDAADQEVSSVRVRGSAPKDTLLGLLPRLKGLRRLDLSCVRCTDNDVVAAAVHASVVGLESLDISWCQAVTPASQPSLSKVPTVMTRGCWKLVKPSPSLSAEEALEIQLLALQRNDPEKDDGVAKHFAFFSRAPGR